MKQYPMRIHFDGEKYWISSPYLCTVCHGYDTLLKMFASIAHYL